MLLLRKSVTYSLIKLISDIIRNILFIPWFVKWIYFELFPLANENSKFYYHIEYGTSKIGDYSNVIFYKKWRNIIWTRCSFTKSFADFNTSVSEICTVWKLFFVVDETSSPSFFGHITKCNLKNKELIWMNLDKKFGRN